MPSPLSEGQMAPDFKISDESGKEVSLRDLKGKNLVLYFYPKDDTPGCTIEACQFRDQFADFQKRNVQIFGISFDNSQSHQAFKQKFSLPFPLLVDAKGQLAQAFGVKGEKYPDRDTILIDAQGKVLKILRGVKPQGHAQEILQYFSGQ